MKKEVLISLSIGTFFLFTLSSCGNPEERPSKPQPNVPQQGESTPAQLPDSVLPNENESYKPPSDGSDGASEPSGETQRKYSLDELAQQAANRYDVDASLVCAIIDQESKWDPNAVSPKGAVGLMQIMPQTGEEACGLAENQLYDPKKNVDCGVRYFSELHARFGSVKLALCAYNAGPHRIVNGKCPRFRETTGYVRKILAAWKPGEQNCPQNVASPAIAIGSMGKSSQAHLSAKGVADYRFVKGGYNSPKIWWKFVCQGIDVVYDREIYKTQPSACGKPAKTQRQIGTWVKILNVTINDIYGDEVRLKQRSAMSKRKVKANIIKACPKPALPRTCAVNR
ncbi:MAG: hypothetical protein DRR08_02590 [Candidatus Parabeggiatoa sp. nov. 2]|nr:MAG: hypothetical protein B6247_00830 [Beggiatoa sp. 4572_84]RKZ63761.1 MAG: hypothetical protein DRR08_02590 [Gammaproteobacteria bacterium]